MLRFKFNELELESRVQLFTGQNLIVGFGREWERRRRVVTLNHDIWYGFASGGSVTTGKLGRVGAGSSS